MASKQRIVAEPKRARVYGTQTFSANTDERTVPMSVSSDTDQILRYVPGIGPAWEVLDHSDIANIDLTRFAGPNGGPMLLDHDRSKLVGRFIPTGIVDGKLQGLGRFGKSARASEAFQDVQDGILDATSCFYDYNPEDVEKGGMRDGYPVAYIRKWSLTEASLVAVPADVDTGVGRAFGSEESLDHKDTPRAPDAPASGDEPAEPGVLSDFQDMDPEDQSIRNEGEHDPDCEDPDCTDDDPCDECMARCAAERSKAGEPGSEELPSIEDGRSEHASTAPGQRSPTPADNSRTTRKDGPMTTENAAAQAATTITQGASPETQEALQIRAIAEQLGHGRKADELLASLPLADARRAVMEHLRTNPKNVGVKSLEEMGASQAEIKEFNYGRACLNAVSLAEGGRSGKNFEAEVSEEIEKAMPSNYKRHGGIFLPYATKGSRSSALGTTIAGQGKEAIFIEPGQVIDVLRNALVTAKLGATVYTGLEAPLGLPRQDTDIVASWVNEDGTTDVAESEFATSLVTLTPKTLQATTATTRQLLELAVKQFDTQARIVNSMAYASQRAIDSAALFGTGISPVPMGIWNAPGVQSVAFGASTGVVPTSADAYQHLVKMVASVANANVPFNKPGFVTNAMLAGLLMSTLEFSVNGSSKVWQGSILEGVMAGMPAMSSQQIPGNLGTGANCQGLIFGSWDNLLIGIFGNGYEVIVDPYSLKKKGIIELTSFNMADVKIAHPVAFAIGTGIALTTPSV